MPETTLEDGSQTPPLSPEFKARQKRFDDAKSLTRPDRVPVAPVVMHYFPNIRKGISNREVHYDRALKHQLWRSAIVDHDWDAAVNSFSVIQGQPLELLGMTQLKWPGGGLPPDRPFQYVEGEYMLQDEYDEVLADPNGFTVKKLWPRVATALAPWSAMAQAGLPPLLPLANPYALPGFIGGMLANPEVMTMLERIVAVGKEGYEDRKAVAAYSSDMMLLGYPFPYQTANIVAFDAVSDMLRGLRGTFLDMYQVPDKLLALVEMHIPWTIEQSIWMARQTGNSGVFLALHRGAAGFMSNEQFAKFYWPGLKALLLGLIDAGLTPIPFFEGDYTSRLEFLQELPAKKVIGHFDRIDRRKAKELLGDVMCFWGNVPSSLLCAGTVQQVKDDVRELIEIFGDDGGLIVDGTVGIPDEARPANIFAMTEAVHEFGSY